MATVREIQIDGGRIVYNLADACVEYLAQLETSDRLKMNFTIILANRKSKHITFRQEGDAIEVYGDFAGMPDALEWALQNVEGK